MSRPQIKFSESQLEHVTSCACCGCDEFEEALDADPWRLQRCSRCRLVMTSPRLTAEGLDRLYEDSYYDSAEGYFRRQAGTPQEADVELVDQVIRHIGSTVRQSVDIGCGAGLLLDAFAAGGFKASGAEPNTRSCDFAREQGRDVQPVPVEDLPDETYGCVTAMHVLEHIREPLEFVEELYRITAPNGIAVIEVPNFGSKASRRLGADWLPLRAAVHLYHFTPETLSAFLRKAGFEVVQTQRRVGAGALADATARPRKSATPNAPRPLSASLVAKKFIWSLRKPVFAFRFTRRLLRWVTWELLGHGEYVRIIARKPERPASSQHASRAA